MAIIQSGATADQWTIDPTSKAGRVTLYDSLGNEIAKPATGSYVADINVRQTAASAIGTTIWTMRNTGALTALIRQISLIMAFDGTAAAATTLRYDIARFSGATPTGGTAVTPVKKRNSYGASSVTDLRFLDTGLTTTGITFESAFHTIALPVSVTSGNAQLHLPFTLPGERYSPFELATGEGLAIRLNVAAVIGLSLTGSVHWDDK